MNTVLYVGLSRQEILQRQLDVTANNIANADTAGFKVEQLTVNTEQATPPTTPGARPVNYVLDHGLARNFSAGELETSGNAYDLAIEGDGFFQVQTPDGMRYTRDGRFTVDAKNQLTDKMGQPVMDNSGRPITLDPTKPSPTIARDGTVSQGPTSIGRVGVYRFADLSALSKVGDNQFQAPDSDPATAAPDAIVHQGVVEKSNVNPVLEITNLINVSRAYEQVANIMSAQSDLSEKAVDRLGKAA